jgi:hypothetical protein
LRRNAQGVPGPFGRASFLGEKRPRSMIRKSGYRFSLGTNAVRVCPEIMLKQKMERDDDSKKRHHVPVFQVLERDPEKWVPVFR